MSSSASTYTETVRKNILPRSVAGTLPEAFDEWEFLNKVTDYHCDRVTCELCEQEDLRWHYEIVNRLTDYKLNIGSRCILRFDIAVYDENGKRLNLWGAEKHLKKLRDKFRVDSCTKALSILAQVGRSDVFANALRYYTENKQLSPKHAYVALSELQVRRIEHRPHYFKISLRKDRHKRDLAMMPPDRVQLLWPALNASQRKLAQHYGHVALSAVRHMTEKARGHSYEAMIAVGWTDALLIAHGMMTA